MTGRFGEIHDTIVASADRAAFEKWVRDFLRPMAAELGETPKPGESDDTRGLRSDVFATLAYYGRDPQVLAKSRVLVEQYMRDPNSVEAALAGNALAVSALEGNADLYDRYLGAHEDGQDSRGVLQLFTGSPAISKCGAGQTYV